MTDATAPGTSASYTTGGAFYRLVWKWHFLASLYVLPFMAMLAITGGIYLYKPQIENWLYADRMHVQAIRTALPIEQQVAAVEIKQWIMRGDDIIAEADLVVAVVGNDGRPRRWSKASKETWQKWHGEAVQAGRV